MLGGILGMEVLENGIGTIVVTYKDGSQIAVVTTLDTEILRDYDDTYDGFIDLVERLRVPNELFSEEVSIEVFPDMEEHISKLSEFVQRGVKSLWKKI